MNIQKFNCITFDSIDEGIEVIHFLKSQKEVVLCVEDERDYLSKSRQAYEWTSITYIKDFNAWSRSIEPKMFGKAWSLGQAWVDAQKSITAKNLFRIAKLEKLNEF